MNDDSTITDQPDQRPSLYARALPFAGALGVLVLFLFVFGDYELEHGALNALRAPYVNFLFYFTVAGLLVSVLLTLGLVALSTGRRFARLVSRIEAAPYRRWLFWCAVVALLLPMLYRVGVLLEQPFADDESAYRFASELLLSGRVTAESHPLKLFFDQSFMINDGRYYPQYFLGWPALMAPFTLVGSEGFANAFYFTLLIIGLGLVLERLVSEQVLTPLWARLGVVLALSSPLLLYTAASGLSHTSCLAALVWMSWSILRLRQTTDDGGGSLRSSALVALCFSIAFFIRPQSAVAVGAPFLVWWLASLRPLSSAQRLRHVVVFAASALPLALLFLAVNQAQNGSSLLVSYQRAISYAEENLYRFTHFPREEHAVHNFDFDSMERAAGQSITALVRYNYASLGWPFAYLFLVFGMTRRRLFAVSASLVFAWGCYFFLTDPGIDSVGPVHYSETLLPFLLLTIAGASRCQEALEGQSIRRRDLAALPLALLLSLVTVNLTMYLPTRARAHRLLAENVRMPRQAAEEAFERAVIFTAYPMMHSCTSGDSRPLVSWWPLNDPDFANDLIWANHLSVEDDRRLVREFFPDRPGYILLWSSVDCSIQFAPLDAQLDERFLPPGLPGGLAGQPDAERQGWR